MYMIEPDEDRGGWLLVDAETGHTHGRYQTITEAQEELDRLNNQD
jgi:hypothetical protein